jgi:YD repeat-containing protein
MVGLLGREAHDHGGGHLTPWPINARRCKSRVTRHPQVISQRQTDLLGIYGTSHHLSCSAVPAVLQLRCARRAAARILNSAHKHDATSVGSCYTAQYDASGNMTCRARGGTNCGSTAAVLGYDNEGRLTAWQNKPSSPTSTDSFLYDGEGNRVAQQSASGGVTTQSVYVGSLMEIRTVTGAPNPGNVVYYSANGARVALMAQGTLS